MKNAPALLAIAMCATTSSCKTSEPAVSVEQSPPTVTSILQTRVAVHPASLCNASDKVVFSCPLAKGEKIVSMCAATSDRKSGPRFYYVFGRPGAVELRFPAEGTTDNATFSRSHLGFAGNTGGYAYAFVDKGYKYIMYSVSGSRAVREGGVIVQPLAGAGAVKRLACQSSNIVETSDETIIDATLRLKKDARIQSKGLRDTP